MQPSIQIKGAREHNLKNINLDIPRDKLVVLTGLSGSGKSSLAFDTIYAEGQRRYVESLSSYARQFLGQMEKPDVDHIDGLSPAISIDQKTTSKNPRSTVGTVTEIYDYLRLLFARVGTPHCPQCGKVIERQSVDQMVDNLEKYPEGTRLILMSPVVRGRKGEFTKLFDDFRRSGYARVRVDDQLYELDEEIPLEKNRKHTIEVVVDRLVMRPGLRHRLTDSAEAALHLADGLLLVQAQVPAEDSYVDEEIMFSQNFACHDCNISLEEITPRMFSFNNPYGACPECTGLGQMSHIDPELVVYDAKLSINDGAIRTGGWNFADRGSWARAFIEALASRYRFSLDQPFEDLPPDVRQTILFGNKGEVLNIDTTNSKYSHGSTYHSDWIGIVPSLEKRYAETSSDDMKGYYEQYMSVTPCPVCHGARLKPESLAVRIGGKNIHEMTILPIRQARDFLAALSLSPRLTRIAEQIRKELDSRLGFLVDVGLDYLTLARASATLSGGEGPADPPGHPDRLRPDGRSLHSRRAQHRLAPAGQRPPARHPETPARSRQHRVGGRARRRNHAVRRLYCRHGARRRRTWRLCHRHRHSRRDHGQRRVNNRPVPQRPPPDRHPFGHAGRTTATGWVRGARKTT